MEEVGKAGRRTEHVVGARKEELDVCVEKIDLVGLKGEQHGKRME